MATEMQPTVRAKELWSRTNHVPAYNGSYRYTPGYEKTIRWLKTPAGTLVRQVDYHYTAWREKGFLWSEDHPEKNIAETEPYEKPINAVRKLMTDANVDMNSAAMILELDGRW